MHSSHCEDHNLKGLEGENSDVVITTCYYGLALRGIRESPSHLSDNSYDIILASMIVMALVEHGIEGMCRG
jgi:hypothetical protein